jgi:Protein of unknown function (DUF3108)
MLAMGRLAAASRSGRLLIGGLFLLAGLLANADAHTTDGVNLDATYIIAINGLTIGRADARSRFTDHGYAAAISGSTYGISRIVSDARATLAGAGRVVGGNIVPASYNLSTSESGFETSVNMTMRSGSIVGLQAIPSLPDAPDRVPLTATSKQNIVDPVGAFVVAIDHPGAPDPNVVCNRTVKVFDGWKRFDIRLSYKETTTIDDGANAYAGNLIVCAARYLPVAGHRAGDDAVAFMADNKRLEISLAPIKGTNYMVPYRILIGTKLGDLTIAARTFTATAGQQQARLD